jgi:CBS domain-containing protein
MKVKDCMCDSVYCVNSETKINEIAKIMGDNHIGCVPVCDNNNCICGIITDRDILLRTIACNKDANTTTASEIMSKNVCTCKDTDDMTNAESKMSEYQIRRLPVCDQNNHVVGILTLGNLAQNDKELGKQEVCTTISDICDCNTHKNDQ